MRPFTSVSNCAWAVFVIHKEFNKARSEAKPITASDIFGISDEDIDIDVDMGEQVFDLFERFELALICME